MIKPVSEVSKNTLEILSKYQSGTIKPVKTNRIWLDDVFGGLIPGDIVTIAGKSGGGKSFENQRLKNYIMDVKNNPSSETAKWLDYSLEMRFLSTMIRDIHGKTKKSKKRILTEQFTPEEESLLEDYKQTLQDGRFFIEEDIITVDQFEIGVLAFCKEHKDSSNIYISLDHIALFKGGDGKKSSIDDIIEIVNRIKKIFPNTYWFILTQLNRNIEGRIKDKDMMAMPIRGDIYQSDSIFFISDYVYVAHNPYALGINDYLKVNANVYDYLSDHFSEVKNGKASFSTLGKIFYVVLKSRESDPVFDNIFIEDVGLKNKEKYVAVATFDSTQEIDAPIFNTPALLGVAGAEFDDNPAF